MHREIKNNSTTEFIKIGKFSIVSRTRTKLKNIYLYFHQIQKKCYFFFRFKNELIEK